MPRDATSISRRTAARTPGRSPRATSTRRRPAPCWPTPTARSAGAGTVILKDSRTTTVAETDDDGPRPADAGDLQAVQPQEVARPAPDLFRPTRAWRAWQAGQHLASRAHPDPAEPGLSSPARPTAATSFWYLPHETYLITVKAEPSITLGDYVREVLPDARPRRAARRGSAG